MTRFEVWLWEPGADGRKDWNLRPYLIYDNLDTALHALRLLRVAGLKGIIESRKAGGLRG